MATHFERRRLFEVAATQGGYFTTAQARAIGYDPRTLWDQVKAGHFQRVNRGFYRLAEFPAQSHEDVIAAWAETGPERAAVSHETALALYDVSPIRPRRLHLAVARAPTLQGTGAPCQRADPHNHAAVPARRRRAAVRCAHHLARADGRGRRRGGDGFKHHHGGGDRALEHGLLVADDLRRTAEDRSERVRKLIDRTIEETHRHAPIR